MIVKHYRKILIIITVTSGLIIHLLITPCNKAWYQHCGHMA